MNIAHGLHFLLWVSGISVTGVACVFVLLCLFNLVAVYPKVGIPLLVLAIGVLVFLTGASI